MLGHATTFYDGPFTVESAYRTIAEHRITNLAGAPTAFRLLMAAGDEAAKAVKGQLRSARSGEPRRRGGAGRAAHYCGGNSALRRGISTSLPGGLGEFRRQTPGRAVRHSPAARCGPERRFCLERRVRPVQRPRMRQMRQRRRTPAVGPDGELPRRAHAAVQPARRDGASGAPPACELSAAEGSHRGDFASSITHCFARTRRQDRAVIEMRRVQRSFRIDRRGSEGLARGLDGPCRSAARR